MSSSLSLAVSQQIPKTNSEKIQLVPACWDLESGERRNEGPGCLWPVEKCPVFAFIPLLLHLRPPGPSGVRLASSDRDPSFTLSSFCLGPCDSLFLEQEHKQNVTQEFQKSYQVKSINCNQDPETWSVITKGFTRVQIQK